MGLSVAAIALGTAAAADEHRQLGPHEHGHGTLNMAVEQNRISLELDVPGMDVVGFEHEPGTPEEKAAAEKAQVLLSQGLTLFKLPEAAQCTLTDAKVSIEAEGEDDHEPGGENVEGGGDHADAGKTEGTAKPAHNDYNASYVIDCAKPAAISTIRFDYFKSFAEAQKLTVNIVTSKAQNTYEATRQEPVINLDGMM